MHEKHSGPEAILDATKCSNGCFFLSTSLLNNRTGFKSIFEKSLFLVQYFRIYPMH